MDPPSVTEQDKTKRKHMAIDLSAVTADTGVDNLGFFDSTKDDGQDSFLFQTFFHVLLPGVFGF